VARVITTLDLLGRPIFIAESLFQLPHCAGVVTLLPGPLCFDQQFSWKTSIKAVTGVFSAEADRLLD
jgi:hypothetical protein